MKVSKNSGKVDERNSSVLTQKILGLAIVLHALGLFLIFFRKHHTHFGNYLFSVLEIDPTRAFAIEKITISIFIILCVINLIYTRAVLLIPIFAYVFFEAWAGYVQGGYHFSELTLGAHALRYLAPVALLFLVLPGNFPSRFNREKITSWILRIGLAVVFITHGMECIQQNPKFIDLLIGSIHNYLGIYITEAQALQIMTVIGWTDVVVALLVLVKPHRKLLAWLCFWATITAFSRMTALGIGAYTEVLLRASHILAPVSVWFLLYKTERQNQPIHSFFTRSSKSSL